MPASGATMLLDANVWLALVYSGHAHHQSAAAWFNQQLDATCGFCRITQLAILRHVTNSKVMGPFVQTQRSAWATVDALKRDPRVLYFEEPAQLESTFRSLSSGDSPSHQLWTDSYLAAFATAANLTVVTFDQGFRRFASLKLETLP